MENYIKSLTAKNVGVFEELSVQFNNRFNFIVGPNGSGKTSILKCLALSVSTNNSASMRYGENSSVWIDVAYDGHQYRIGAGEGWIKGRLEYRKGSLLQTSAVKPPAANGIMPMHEYDLRESNINITPLILGAYRRIEYRRIEGMKREATVSDQRREYRISGLKSIEGGSLPDIKQWMINRYFEIDKDWARLYKRNWDWIIGNLTNLAPSNCRLEFKHIKRDLEPMFTAQGLDCYLEEISAGFQAMLSLVFAIVEWIEGTNEEEFAYIPEATGTVVVDELDVHLHPEWQLTIRKSLATLFPKLQFIITTHSPHLIATAEPGELIILPELSRILCVQPTSSSYAGWNTDQILEEVMGVKTLENKMYATLLNEAMSCVEAHDIPALRQAIEKIEKVVHPSNTILHVLRLKLAQLELEGKND